MVVTCSNRSAAGEREDASGPGLVAALSDAGWDVAPEAVVIPDDEALIARDARAPGRCRPSADPDHRRVPGSRPTDVTPAATRRVIDREVPGLAELMRSAGIASTPMASLSRGIVATRGHDASSSTCRARRAALPSRWPRSCRSCAMRWSSSPAAITEPGGYGSAGLASRSDSGRCMCAPRFWRVLQRYAVCPSTVRGSQLPAAGRPSWEEP